MEERNVSVASALQLLNSLARDLDHMLNDLSLEQDYSNADSVTRVTKDRGQRSESPDVIANQKRLLLLGSNGNGNQEDSAVSSCSEPESSAPAAMSVTERLVRTHQVWFLPGLQRAGAEHLLRGRPAGTFLVRQCSRSPTMVLSVRLPTGVGPQVDHFLVSVTDGKLHLQTSEAKFDSISSLVAYYSQPREELPVQLQLPASLQRVPSRHQLSSLALLGQDFWTCRLPGGGASGGSVQSSPAGSLDKSSPGSSFNNAGSSASSLGSGGGLPAEKPAPQVAAQRRASVPSTSVLRVSDREPTVVKLLPVKEDGNTTEVNRYRPGSDLARNFSTDLGSPAGSVSSLTRHGNSLTRSENVLTRLRSPELVSRVSSPTCGISTATRSGSFGAVPRPPPRYNQPSLSSPADLCDAGRTGSDASAPGGGGEKLVSTATFQVSALDGGTIRSEMSVYIGGPLMQKQQTSEPATAEENAVYSIAKSLSNGSMQETKTKSVEAAVSPVSTPGPSPDECVGQPLSGRRRPRKKRSTHYQESDLLRSPDAYFRSSVADKISDYEDIWASPARETPPGGAPFFFPPSEAVSQASRETAEALRDLAREASAPSPLYAVPADAIRQGQQDHSQQKNNRTNRQSYGQGQRRTGAGVYSPTGALLREESQSGSQPDLVTGVQRRDGVSQDRSASHRHSEPVLSSRDPPRRLLRPGLAAIDASDEGPLGSSPAAPDQERSARPLAAEPRNRSSVQQARIQSPRRAPKPRRGAKPEQWRLDSSWEFLGHDSCDADTESDDGRPTPGGDRPVTRQSTSTEPAPDAATDLSPEEQTRIVHAIIRQSLPQAVPPDTSVSHASEYDNLRPPAAPRAGHPQRPQPPQSPKGDTEVSKWQSIMRLMSDQLRLKSGHFDGDERLFTDSESFVMASGDLARPAEVAGEAERTEEERTVQAPLVMPPRLPLPSSQQESLYSPPRLNSLRLHRKCQQSGAAIRDYVIQLASDDASTFALCIFNFLRCTREGNETDPHVVMRNMRQFINGMKNYLVKHGEADFQQVVHREREKLSSTEFLNLDAILEGVLEELLVTPLHDHVSRLWREAAQRTGATQRLVENFEFARGRSAAALGMKPDQAAPSETVLESARQFLDRMQESASPLDKLESLLSTVSVLFAAAGDSGETLPADAFLPLLLYTLVRCDVTNVEFEADYMWGLLHPLLLSGEAGYYLTMLSSAVHVLKNLLHYLGERGTEASARLQRGAGPCGGSDTLEGYLRVLIPDEQQGTILSRTLPARPGMTARDVCRMLDHKLRITSPQDFGLFKLINGEETLVGEHECPQKIKRDLSSKGVHCMLAYKRLEAKIAWPTAQL